MTILLNTHIDLLTEHDIESCLTWFPPDQVVRIQRMKHIQGRREKVATYQLLVDYFRKADTHAPLPQFIYTEQGKPLLANYPLIHISISHCSVGVAVALNEKPVGIDIERIRNYPPALAQRVFNAEELERMNICENPDKEFCRIWTRKEAYVKWTGTGITGMDQLKALPSLPIGCQIETQDLPGQNGVLSWCC